MQITIDSEQQGIDEVLRVLGAVYGVELSTAGVPTRRPAQTSRRRATKKRNTRGKARSAPSMAEVRAWAQANGHRVADRGRIPASVIDAFTAASTS
jgi:hypothetical protein